ncbi:MAG: NADP(H)-dependent aldo-keto reductase [Bacteriovoracaceae bacterium]
MDYRKLGNTDLKVSSICLGTMTWGEQNTEAEAHEQLDYALERGVNFIDTAEMYPVPPTEETYTKTEEYIGRWDKLKTNRDQIIVATKIAGKAEWLPYVRNGKNCFDKENIKAAIDGSLKRLGLEYIDLYQLHWPDRQTNFFGQRSYTHNPEDTWTPLEETLEALQEIQKEGKVRHFGLSNETPWGTMKYMELHRSKGLPRMMSIQNPYNLLNRTYETAMAEVSHREECGLLAYSPMAFGVLSGKYLGGKRPEGSRLTMWDRFARYTSKNAEAATQKYFDIAQKHGTTLAKLSLQFVTSRPFVTSNIIGATSMEQLKENIDSTELELTAEILKEIDAVHEDSPNPCP